MTVLVKRNLLLVENIGHLYVKIKRKLAADRSCGTYYFKHLVKIVTNALLAVGSMHDQKILLKL